MEYKIRNTFSPEVRNPKIESIINIDVLLMSCGGGMGGSSWREFIIPEKPYPSNVLIELKDAFDKTGKSSKVINTSFVVKIEHKKLVEVSYDMTANSNFGYVKTEYYAIDRDDTIVVVGSNEPRTADSPKPNSVAWTDKYGKLNISY